MQKKPKSCKSCGTIRRPIKRVALCSKCYYWDIKLTENKRKLEALKADPFQFERYHPISVISEIRTATRVLEELKWREDGLIESENSSEHLRCILFALASYSNSVVGDFAVYALEEMTPESRGIIYRLLLTLVENLPTRLPVLSSWNLPEKRTGRHDGWMEWNHTYERSGQARIDYEQSRDIQDLYYEMKRIQKAQQSGIESLV